MNIRRTSPWNPLLGFFAAGAVLTAMAARSHAEEIRVPLDYAQPVTFSTPMRMVSIGNPAIADITVVDRTHVLILGKTYGATNIVGFDVAGHEAMNQQIVVTDRPGGTVTVQRGIARTTLMCTSEHCETAPAPGDDATGVQQKLADPPYDALTSQMDKREASGVRAAGGK
jgi:hypothetical protein